MGQNGQNYLEIVPTFLCFPVVVGVLGFPIATDEVHFVLEHAVGADRLAVDLLFLLANEGPPVRLAGVSQQAVEGMAGAHFEQDILAGEFGQICVVFVGLATAQASTNSGRS